MVDGQISCRKYYFMCIREPSTVTRSNTYRWNIRTKRNYLLTISIILCGYLHDVVGIASLMYKRTVLSFLENHNRKGQQSGKRHGRLHLK